jgi:predicted Zn-dependent peptidase
MLSLLAGAVLSHLTLNPPIFGESHRFELPIGATLNQDTGRLRTILPNGAVIWVEHVPRAERLIVQLFISSRSLPNDSLTSGRRHLLEHLTALGSHLNLDQTLEAQGAFLTAETLRDATMYQICLRPSDLSTALDAVRSLMQLGEVTPSQIVNETEIIRQEIALDSGSRELSRVAWKIAFGDYGADPLGDPKEIALTTPSDLAALHKQEFAGSNLTMTISGDVDLDAATADAKSVLALAPSIPQPVLAPRKFLGGGVSSTQVEGEALAAYVDSWNSPKTSARLAAALCIAAGVKDSFVTYTPSLMGSLIVVGRTGESSGLDKLVASLNVNSGFALGRSLAKSWVDKQQSVQDGAILTGLLLSEGAGQRANTALENLDQMTPSEFGAALNAFRSSETVHVIGQ